MGRCGPDKERGEGERASGESAFAIPFKGAPCTIKAGRPKQSCEKMNGAGQTDRPPCSCSVIMGGRRFKLLPTDPTN